MRVDEGQNTLSFAAGNGDFKRAAKIKKSNTPYYLFIQCSGHASGKIAKLQNYSCSDGGGDDAKQTENERQIESVMEEKEIANAKISSLEEMVRNLRAEQKQSQKRVEDLTLKMKSQQKQHELEVNKLRLKYTKELEKITQKLQKTQSLHIMALKDAESTHQIEVEQLRAQIHALRGSQERETQKTRENEQLIEENDAMKRDNVKLKKKMADLQNEHKKEELEVFKGKYFDSEQKKVELSDQIETMQEQMAVLMEEKQEMNVRNQSLMQQVSEMQEEEKQREEEVQRLKEEVKRLKLQCIEETQYEQWSHENIAAWILNLDNGRLNGYEKILRKSLKEEDVDGELLRDINGSDLKRWGITKMRDFKFLQQEIAKLVAGKAEQGSSNTTMMDANALANEGANAAPTAFV